MAYDRDVAERLREALAGEPGVTEKSMFGGLAFLVNGHLSVSASSRGGLMLRVDPAEGESLAREPHAEPFVMRGKELAGWLRVDVAVLDDDAAFDQWVARGVAYARSLPSK